MDHYEQHFGKPSNGIAISLERMVRTEGTIYPDGTVIAADGTRLQYSPDDYTREKRTAELLAKIPRGTVCTEDNCCGGFLTQAEADELEKLLTDPTDVEGDGE